jgi:DNA-binding Xre family transcriptional regulator
MPVRIDRKLVKVRMAEKEWTLADLAHHSDVHENTLRRLLNGEKFQSDTLGRLAEALGVHPVDLIEADGYSYPHMDAPALSVAAQ